MITLSTYVVQKNIPFQMYLLSNSTVKRILREFEFYNVRFYRLEKAKELTVHLDYPTGNMYWYLDFKKYVEELILSKASSYEQEWNSLLSELKSRIKAEFEGFSQRIQLIKPVEVVAKMNEYNLRDYQAFDLLQLCVKMQHNPIPAGLILSEQRTGKTRVAVAAIQEAMKEGQVLVICPKSAIPGWVAEFEEMSRYTNKDLFKIEVIKHTSLKEEVNNCPYLVRIVSYDLFKRFTPAQLKKLACTYNDITLVCDEVHRLRNFKTMQSDALYRFKATCLKNKIKVRVLGLTGTPAIKSSSDIFGVFSLINSSKICFNPYIKDFNQFKEHFYNCEDTSYGKICRTLKRTHELNFLIQSCSVQTKQRDLAMFSNYEKKPIKVTLDMDEEQAKIYESVLTTMEFEDEIDCKNSLVQLVRLQQICIDPSSLVSSYASLAPKIKWIVEFSKKKSLKTIVMAKKVKALKALAKAFDEEGIPYTYLDGSCSMSAREDAKNTFKESPDVKFILMQLDAGREAHTLPEAKCTIFLDRDYAQGFNEQAEARMTPIDGVACTKYVVDLVMRGTIEEGIYDVLVIRKDSIDTVNTVRKICEKGG